MARRRTLTLGVPQSNIRSYGLEDVYSSYFSPSPRDPMNVSRTGTPQPVETNSKDAEPSETPEAPSDTSPSPYLSTALPAFSEYRDSPIMRARVSRSLPSSPDTPLSERTYLWDPTEFEWRVIELTDWGSQSEVSESDPDFETQGWVVSSQPTTPILRRKAHIRRASEPPNLQLPVQSPSTLSFPRNLQLYDSNESHPTLELAIRYSQPSPLTPFFDFPDTPPDNNPIVEVEKRIFVQILGAFNLTQTGVLKRNPKPYADISIAGQEFRTSTPERRTTTPVWNSNFLFESVKDTDSIVIRVWSDAGSSAQRTWHGSFMCTVRRMLLMQAINHVLTLTLDRWPNEGQVLESTQCGTITMRIRDLTSPTVREVPIPFTPVANIPKFDNLPQQYTYPITSPPFSQTENNTYVGLRSPIPHIVISEEDSLITPPTPPSPKEIPQIHPKWFTDIVGRTLSLTRGRYPWIPTGDVAIIDGPVCGGRYCDIYIGELRRARVTRVALKQLRVFVNASDNMRKMFCREVQFWSRLRHPNVLPFWGCWELDEYRLFMISPWAANGNSLQYVKKNPDVDRRRILWQTAKALAYLHSGEDGNALVHGDLKADNVLISETGDALLADFGLTRYVEKLASVSCTPSGLSAHGHTRFSAPELLLPQPGKEPRPTPESDVFAFACLLIQIYTEEMPFSDIKVEAQVITEIIGRRTPTRPEGVALQRGLDDDLWAIANECWRFATFLRPSMSQVANKLR